MTSPEIPRNFFLYWVGQEFYYVNYLCIETLLKTNKVDRCEIYYEEEPLQNKYWDALKKAKNIRLIKVNYTELLKSAGKTRKEFSDFFANPKIAAATKGNFFRLLVLYCYGGVYLDFDTITLRDFGPLLKTDFFAAYQDWYVVNNAVVGATRKAPAINTLLNHIAACFDTPQQEDKINRLSIGPDMFTIFLFPKSLLGKAAWRMLRCIDGFKLSMRLLGFVRLLSKLTRNQKGDYQVYPRSFFYMYSWDEWKKIFQPNLLPRDAFVIHYWNGSSHNFTSKIDETYIKNSDSLYAHAVRKVLS